MSWEKYCEENASAPDSDGWIYLLVGILVVMGILVLIVVL